MKKTIIFLIILFLFPLVNAAGLQNPNPNVVENSIVEETKKIETNIKTYIDLKSNSCVEAIEEKSNEYIDGKMGEIKKVFFIEKLLIFFSGFVGALGGSSLFKILKIKREKNIKREMK